MRGTHRFGLLAALTLAAPVWSLGASSGCSQAPPPAKDAVATVNGASVTRAQVDLRLRGGGGHEQPAGPTPAARRAALDAIVAQELEAQQARALGLADAPSFRALDAQLEATSAEARRKELARLYEEHLASTVQLSDAELDAFIAQQAPRTSQEVRVSQLLFKGRAEADALAAALDAGAPFDEAAARFFPGLPAGQRPWELGFLQYQQVPEQWWPTLERLAPGEVSAPIAGPNERFWVLRLDERRPSQATPQALRAGLRAAVRARKVEAARAAAAQELRSRAMLQHVDDP